MSAAIVEWGAVPHTPIAITTSGPKVQVKAAIAEFAVAVARESTAAFDVLMPL